MEKEKYSNVNVSQTNQQPIYINKALENSKKINISKTITDLKTIKYFVFLIMAKCKRVQK